MITYQNSQEMDYETIDNKCECKALVCGIEAPAYSTGAKAKIYSLQSREHQISLAKIARATFDHLVLAKLRETITEGNRADMEKIFVLLKTPRIGISLIHAQGTELKVEPIKLCHLSIIQGAVMVNNRAWIPNSLEWRVTQALHTDSHKCVTRMSRKAVKSVYFINMTSVNTEMVRRCEAC